MSVVNYEIQFGPMMWACQVSIDEEMPLTEHEGKTITTKDAIQQMVEFWTGWESRLDSNEGDYTATFLKQLAKEIFRVACTNRVKVKTIVDEFEGKEGWAPMDGSYGITIISIDTFTFVEEDFSVYEFKKKEAADGKK